jgi:c-di-GMP-binding flagellar brake protein YcgR
MENRRQHTRYNVAVAAEVTQGDDTVEGETRDISAGGVSVMLSMPLQEGGTVALSLILTQDGIEDPNEEPFETRASVMWCAGLENGVAMSGLRFTDVAPAQRKRLERFLSLISPA